jgi:hypothetical protein
MIDDKFRRAALPVFALFFFLGGATTARAQNGDDFEKIVHHIESRYHAHRNYGFLMAVAGFAAKAWHTSGVKDVKIALFEDQQVLRSASDREMDELIEEAGSSGWQPLVKSVSRRRGDHIYIYARTEGKDLRMLVVNVEPNEAEVVEVKLDPRKLDEFVNQHCRRDSKPSRELAFN